MQSQLKNKGEKAEQPETPVRSGYVFDGWFSTDDFSDEFDFETVLDEDVVLYAKWIKQYNVVFNTMGGSEVETVLITEGALLEAPQTLPAKDDTISADGIRILLAAMLTAFRLLSTRI